MNSVAVILITHQSERVLEPCLEQLARLPDLSVLVVDNASTDGTCALATRYGVPLAAQDRNLGFAAAANIGARLAGSPLLCFLNPDCRLDHDTLAAARHALATHPRACATPDLVQDGALAPGRQPGYTWRKILADLAENNPRHARLARHLRASPRHHDLRWHWPLGTCLFVPAEFFREVGGFDERYFLYMEDVEFGWRVRQAGGEVISLGTQVTHVGQQGSAIAMEQRLHHLNTARIQFARIHYGPLMGWMARRLAAP